jgi:hypothetical protein
VIHAAISALITRSANINGYMVGLASHVTEVVKGRSFTHGAHMSQTPSKGLRVVRNELATPKDYARQQRHDRNKDVQGS